MSSVSANSDERIMGFVAHASVVAFGPGILVGVLIWLNQREKSQYASMHGLQAAIYQLVGMIVAMALWVIWGVLYAFSMIPIMQNPEQFEDAPPPLFWVGLGAMVVPLLVMVLWGMYGLWGSVQALRGRDFHYPGVGRLLEASSV